MTYKQMAEATGLTLKTAYRNINKLEELGIIEIVERNANAGKGKNTYKKANKYRFKEINETVNAYVTYSSEYINKEINNTEELLLSGILGLFPFDTDKLKEILPKNQYYTYKQLIEESHELSNKYL